MKLGAYLPSLPKVSQEVIATVIGIVAAAWIVQQWPQLREFVRRNRID